MMRIGRSAFFAIASIVMFTSAAAAQAPEPAPATPPPQNYPAAPQMPSPNGSGGYEATSRWIASGFVGSNFANNANPASMDVGGSVAYLVKNRYGLELDTGFTPNFQLQNNFFGLGVTPQVNSFMGNAVFAQPVGPDGRWQPFVSGGAGAISLRSGMTSSGSALTSAFNADDTRFGGNVGGGFMGFSGNWGFKADVRYYRASGSYNNTTSYSASGTSTSGNPGSPMPTPGGPYGIVIGATGPANNVTAAPPVAVTNVNTANLADAALSGLHFWRANVGVAFRW